MAHVQKKNQAWVVAIDMGYGHLRAAYPLRHLSPTGKVIAADAYESIPRHDERAWKSIRQTYEFFSRLESIPVIGHPLFKLLDGFQEIPPFYPRRDLSAPDVQLRQIYRLIHSGLNRHLIDNLNHTADIPLITTFFSVAFSAEEHGFKNDIYLVICDTDVSRAWAPLHPEKSRIKYFAPTERVVERLKMYGVRKERIFLTGFPLPDENIGGMKQATLKADFSKRINHLDPEKKYRSKHNSALTLTFAIGGAGAQRGIAHDLIMSLAPQIKRQALRLNVVAGSRHDIYHFFRNELRREGLEHTVRIIFSEHKENYFKEFNEVLRTTDILWTKPSELSFYAALGLPIIIAPPVGSQEVCNRQCLLTTGTGIDQEDPRYAHEWLCDWVASGSLAKAAVSGFLESEKFGVQNIENLIFRQARNHRTGFTL